jgi:hypothetical protein
MIIHKRLGLVNGAKNIESQAKKRCHNVPSKVIVPDKNEFMNAMMPFRKNVYLNVVLLPRETMQRFKYYSRFLMVQMGVLIWQNHL